MCFHQLQPRGRHAPVQSLSLGQFHPRHGFQYIQHCFKINNAAFNLVITMITRLQHKIVIAHRMPEALIIHWLKPLLDFIYGFEFSHLFKNTIFGFASATTFEKAV